MIDNINFQILFASSLIGVISFIGLLAFSNNLVSLAKYFISIAIGTILGDVFFHILPEILQEKDIDQKQIFGFLLLGILIMFLLESRFRHVHCHEVLENPEHNHNDNKTLGKMNLVSNSLHNFVDGVFIASSFLISPSVGFATTIAIISHEIPTEISNFMILIHSGYSKKKAIIYNGLTAFFGLLGSILIIMLRDRLQNYLPYISALTAGFLLYIAMSDLIPEVHSNKTTKTSNLKTYLNIFLILTGIGFMYYLSTLE